MNEIRSSSEEVAVADTDDADAFGSGKLDCPPHPESRYVLTETCIPVEALRAGRQYFEPRTTGAVQQAPLHPFELDR
jgi:hypothetical protein